MLRTLLVLGLAIGVSSFARAQEADLEKAKKTYADTNEKARVTLLEAFAAVIKTASGAGSLDAIKVVRAEKESFQASGKVPTSARMKPAATYYQQTMKPAALALEKVYEQAISDLTKANKIPQAEALQAELKEFRGKAAGAKLRPTDVTTKEDIQNYLSDSTWVWDAGLKLNADGSTEQRNWQAAKLVTRWEVVDRRTVVLLIEKGRDTDRTATLVFSEDLTEAKGFGFDGVRITSLKRK